jgi:hypothetical protein
MACFFLGFDWDQGCLGRLGLEGFPGDGDGAHGLGPAAVRCVIVSTISDSVTPFPLARRRIGIAGNYFAAEDR